MKKRSALAAALTLTMVCSALPLNISAAPADPGTDQENNESDTADTFEYSSYPKGVTVEADSESPTGYTATFVYAEEDSYDGLGEDITSVELYSDCMYLFTYEEQTAGSIDPSTAHNPEEFAPGMYPAGGNGDTTYYAAMTEFEDGLWGARVPLSSGAFVYNFRVTDSEGNQLSRLDDPSNPTVTNTATGIHSLSSMVYVPYNSETMGTGVYADRSVELPRTDGQTGTVETISYTGAAGDTRGLAVYLPYGYDADREEPYKVLYLSHGNSGDRYGNELRWMNEGAVANIMDNLISEGKTEPFVVVTMNNQDLGWNYDSIWAEQELIMDCIESGYNVCDSAEGRAFAGLSMGGITTSNMLMNHLDEFSYYGIWSAANTGGLTEDVQAQIAAAKDQIHVLTAAGEWDFGLSSSSAFGDILTELDVDRTHLQVPGAHDWETWQLIYAYAAENFFWKAESQTPADDFDYSQYDKGVTVEADPESPTGYTATFVYTEEDSYEGLGSDIAKVELYSDCMYLFTYDEQTAGSIDASKAHDPSEYEPGMYPAGGNGDTTYYAEMTEFEDGLWGVRVPLSSGAFVYNFRVTDSEGNQLSRLDDPSNPTLINTATGIHSLSSMVYVPYNSETMGTGAYADRSVELPRTDGQTGTVETISYTGAEEDIRGLAVYLPYGYDADREEPYKVLYLSHGASGDQVGNELRWMNEGAVANIMDNLIAEGKTEPFVVVTMNNQDLSWDFDRIWAEQEIIMELIESDYNVYDSAEGRAFAGLSMGGYTTSNVYMNHADEFSYFGIWSYANVNGMTDEVKDALMAMEEQPHLFLAAGEWDYLLSPVKQYSDILTDMGIDHDYLQVPGAHDWETWQLIYAYAAENFFWKAESQTPADDFDYSQYDKGVTVEADPESPTGYTAIFVYAEEDSYEGLGSDIAKVELYSDCMYLFTYDEQTEGAIDPATAHDPSEYEPGMYPAGGNGDTTYYAEMTEFEDGLWGVRVPLSSGAFVYNFRVTDSEGNQLSRLDDPSNPTMINTATGIHSLSSMVYVPYNSETMGTGAYADRSVELPRTDGKTGTVETISYTGAAGDTRGLAVYLPYGYDADREEPYKVLYLSHGGSGDLVGNELRWMNEGAVPNIMDNLIAENKIEPFVVVTMNSQDLGWDYDKIWAEQEIIMALIEKDYNVYDSAEGRAFAGLSMGGITTSNMYMYHIDEFSYYGIWSAANTDGLTEEVKAQLVAEKDKVHVLTAAGEWDYALPSVDSYRAVLTELGIPYEHIQVPGAHDWETWQQLYAYAAENFFWKADTSTDPGTTDPGTTDPGTTDPGTTDPGTTDPGTTDPGSSNGGNNNGTQKTSGAVKTGDTLNMGFAVFSAAAAFIVLAAVLIIRRKRS